MGTDSSGGREELPPVQGCADQHNSAQAGGTQYITGGGDVRHVNVYLGASGERASAVGAFTPAPAASSGRRLPARVRTSLMTGVALVAAGAVALYFHEAPRTSEAAGHRAARPDASTSGTPSPSASPSPTASSSAPASTPASPDAKRPPAAPPANDDPADSTPAPPEPDPEPSRSRTTRTTPSRAWPEDDRYCSKWMPTAEPDVEMQSCTYPGDDKGTASFGSRVTNRSTQPVVVSVQVNYAQSGESHDCGSEPWTVTLAPGGTWRSGLTACSAGSLHGTAVQAQGWAAGGKHPSPRTVQADAVQSRSVHYDDQGNPKP
ncbi:hypothetical protein [Streptomyces sp. AC602_WCS936]|uniref:hypothetical protein n=1 Tax=Streptomyces sp. AC602_WCS936 TaxID=2823685 RepID=UPI001C2800F7|nr:hypothetical protein [Streptomyces sp. AC602_WCS936]